MKQCLQSGRGTPLRKNNRKVLRISLNPNNLENIFIINGNSFITENVSKSDLIIAPRTYYLIINKGKNKIEINYNLDVSKHLILYNPYKYEHSEKIDYDPKDFIKIYKIPNGYIDILPKWYSIKFTYPNYNLIFIKPEMGISIQIHKNRSETWEILEGKPIILNGNKVYYFVKKGIKFQNSKMVYHSVINPNKDPETFVIIRESWKGQFDESDIKRVYNPNDYH